MINAIIFDVDDTLYDQQQPFRNAVEKMIPHFDPQNHTQLYLRFRVHSDDHFEKVVKEVWTMEQFRNFRIQQSLRDLNYEALSDEASLVFQKTYEDELHNIQMHPAMTEVLDYLATQEVVLGIITNGPTDHQTQKVAQLALDRWIDQDKVIVSQATGFQKPDVEIFDLAKEQFGLQDHNILYVGDNFDNDVVGAKNAGWSALWLNHRLRMLKEGQTAVYDAHVTTFADTLDAIKSLLA